MSSCELGPKFITFEGGEGSGKSTQVRLLENYLRARGVPVVATREPGGTPGAEALRTLLKDTPAVSWDAVSQSLILYAARHDLVEKVIQPALKAGAWVLCDRFADSTQVYQGYAQGVSLQGLEDVHKFALGSVTPDLTFFLDLPLDLGEQRRKKRLAQSPKKNTYDAFEARDRAFHAKVREGFQRLAERTHRLVTVPAQQPIQAVHQKILQTLAHRFPCALWEPLPC